jgi:hypothetical protein
MNITLFNHQMPACTAFSLCLGLGSSAYTQVTVERAWVRPTAPLTLELKAEDASIAKVEVKAIASFSPPAP